ncbi:hypothetical protein ACSNOH_18175 [Streptomyces sp. URMC 127]|uniref:hypothetical protein n=1 Tax=Streptomyces sp. URMC 127 TaxID=3423402 RepID=UPI003F1E1F2A
MDDHMCCCRHAGCACTKPPAREAGKGGAGWIALAVAALLGWGLLNGGHEQGGSHGEPVRRPSPGVSASGSQ